VAEYVVDCYGKFIEMGVDAFRIDTSGHISPLTFNKQFIPQFQALGEKYKSKRLNGAPFYMFGEVCQRFSGSVVYRDQPNLSCYFYTWKSDQALLDEVNGDPAWWRQQNLPEGHDTPVGPMAVCEKDTKDKPRSNNAWMVNGAWHEPDYSQSSGFNIIDFPVHYNYKNVGEIQQYFKQDNYYNDASFNVVYVDSPAYGPGPKDGIRFNGGTAQWAENLSWMFTFRGIPCLYYGSEVEFQAGKLIDDGMNTALINTGRAYFGHYLEGNVKATDFAQYTADGQVAATLKGDLAHHIQQLNKIRAAVPALRKGQYTYDGCSANGGWAFKRAYTDESSARVAVNGGATFTNVPAGTYTDIVTGKTYQGGGSIKVDAP
ncbi:MAG: alpha-amylase, partial [Muribaculaceae bacterium]|nr:alpha-amylase [Muribaculaceae bacterium]